MIMVKFVGQKPLYMSEHASGADICASEDTIIRGHSFAIVPTGLQVEIPIGFEIQVRGRSGLAAKHGIGPVNGIGTIDADFRGEIKVILANHSNEDFTVKKGERVAQLVLVKVERAEFAEGDLSETKRADKGLGSTGR